MRNRNIFNQLILSVICFLLFVLLAMPVMAQDSLLISYQGKLSNSSGDPLTGNFDITFKLYSTQIGSTALWSETHNGVSVSNGLFNIILGSQTPLMDTILNGSNRYLGIRIGTDYEISPRTLLTSSPRAAVAGKVMGDIETTNGSLMLKDNNGDSSIVLSNDEDGSSIRMFDPQSKSLGMPKINISTNISNGPAIRLFNPQIDTPGKMFELVANVGSGPSMSFFNHAGEVMGVEPSPFNTGFSWVLFDPQPEPPGKMFEIITEFETKNKSTSLNIYSDPLGGANQELITMSATGSDAEMRMGMGAPSGSSSSYISLKSDASGGTIEVVGAGGATASPPIMILSDATTARIGIGTSDPLQALHVVGNICYTGSIGTCSDAAFKKDIEPINDALDAVDHIRGVKYSWRTEQFPEKKFSSDRQVGLIAQEVKEVLPEAVALQTDGYYTIDYSRLTPLLLEAIKELKKQNDDLTKRLEALEENNR
ncbi:MAG: tail fiber domain-containing protein [bacterium]